MSTQPTHQVHFADCYVLTHKRTKEFILSFLNTFLPHRQEYTGSMQLSDPPGTPSKNFSALEDLLAYLEQHPQQTHAAYWYNKEEAVLKGAMCIFTSDGQVIVGLFCESNYPDPSVEKAYLKAIQDFCNSTTGLIEYQTPAARDTDEFLQRIRAQQQVRKA